MGRPEMNYNSTVPFIYTTVLHAAASLKRMGASIKLPCPRMHVQGAEILWRYQIVALLYIGPTLPR